MHQQTRKALQDWATITVVATTSLALSTVPPDAHTFILLDRDISHPHRARPKVPPWLQIALSILLPAVTITTCTLLRPGMLASLNASLLGLATSLTVSTVVWTGVKNLSGVPRPDFLAICKPDVEHVERYRVGGYAAGLGVMVDREICTANSGVVSDAFRAFPSGYATVAFAGLVYLSLWLCGWYGVTWPRSMAERRRHGLDDRQRLLDDEDEARQPQAIESEKPLYWLFLPLTPLGLAIFIAGTRYFDFRSHGFDVLAGSAVGATTAYFGWRWCCPEQL